MGAKRIGSKDSWETAGRETRRSWKDSSRMRDESQRAALPPLVGGLLVGGGSRRMGSAKALLEWEGESFVERIAGVLAEVVPELALLGSALLLPAKVAGLPAISDRAEIQGPLAGLLGAFAARPGAAWLVLTCDQPLVSRAALEWLIGERRANRIAVLPRLAPGRIEPFPGVYEPACLPALAALAGGGRRGSLQPLAELAEVRVVPVPLRLRGELRGVNTPAEWAELRRDAGRPAKDPRPA
jgi:molybdopterin-guanine dinucleotide biosynthesis protein A